VESSHSPAIQKLLEHFGPHITEIHNQYGDDTVLAHRDQLRPMAQLLRDDTDLHFNFLVDITCVDYLNHDQAQKTERYEMVYHFLSLKTMKRIRLKFPVPAGDEMIESLYDMWKTADWQEREVYDMFGIQFQNHPNMKRILCHHEFVGHALRKDYKIRRGQFLSTNDTLMDEMEKRLIQKGLK